MINCTTEIKTKAGLNMTTYIPQVLQKMNFYRQKGIIKLPGKIEYVHVLDGWRCSTFRAIGPNGKQVFYNPSSDKGYKTKRLALVAAYRALFVEFGLDASIDTGEEQGPCKMCERYDKHIQSLEAEVKDLYNDFDLHKEDHRQMLQWVIDAFQLDIRRWELEEEWADYKDKQALGNLSN